MKPRTRLGTTATVDKNLAKARKLLAETEYRIFSPATDSRNKKGFVAINWQSKPSMVSMVVLVRSRGSFIEVQFDDVHHYGDRLRLLRKILWVPIHMGQAVSVEESRLKDLISSDEHAEFDTLSPYVRL